MGKEGSADKPAVLPIWVALAAWVAGVGAMGYAVRAALPLGLRPALIIAETCLALPSLLAFASWRVPWGRGLALTRVSGLGALLAVLTGAALWAASLGLLHLQYAMWAPPPGFLEQFQALHRALRPSGVLDGAFSVAAIALAPAIAEEILFRGTLLRSFIGLFRPWGAIVVSALLFGAIHMDLTTGGVYTWYRVPFAASVGIGLGILFVRSRSLVPCILAHATLNTITFATVFFTEPSAELEAANVLEGAGLFVLGVAASAWLIRLHARAQRV
jgi:membrane protease YdiL (CAAX protease family)